jgi:hypothetical protein
MAAQVEMRRPGGGQAGLRGCGKQALDMASYKIFFAALVAPTFHSASLVASARFPAAC